MKTHRLITICALACALAPLAEAQKAKSPAPAPAAGTITPSAVAHTPVTFEWDASPAEGVTEYRLYEGDRLLGTTNMLTLAITIQGGFSAGEHTICVKAYAPDTPGAKVSGESDCATLTFNVLAPPTPTPTPTPSPTATPTPAPQPPQPPRNLRMKTSMWPAAGTPRQR